MSFDNYHPNRKDILKPYRKSKAFDRTCRNHGTCPWCQGNRLHKNKIDEFSSREKLKENG